MLEVIVAIAITAILAALVYPVIQRQIDQAQATHAAADMTALRMALQTFELNVRKTPLYVAQFVNPITTNDSTLDFEPYSAREAGRWRGPYLDRAIDPATGEFEVALETGFGGGVLNAVVCIDPILNTTAACGDGMVIAVIVEGIIGREFELINDLLDSVLEPDGNGPEQSREEGRLRFEGTGIDLDLSIGQMYYILGVY